jgi:hypothetical protein
MDFNSIISFIKGLFGFNNNNILFTKDNLISKVNHLCGKRDFLVNYLNNTKLSSHDIYSSYLFSQFNIELDQLCKNRLKINIYDDDIILIDEKIKSMLQDDAFFVLQKIGINSPELLNKVSWSYMPIEVISINEVLVTIYLCSQEATLKYWHKRDESKGGNGIESEFEFIIVKDPYNDLENALIEGLKQIADEKC